MSAKRRDNRLLAYIRLEAKLDGDEIDNKSETNPRYSARRATDLSPGPVMDHAKCSVKLLRAFID